MAVLLSHLRDQRASPRQRGSSLLLHPQTFRKTRNLKRKLTSEETNQLLKFEDWIYVSLGANPVFSALPHTDQHGGLTIDRGKMKLVPSGDGLPWCVLDAVTGSIVAHGDNIQQVMLMAMSYALTRHFVAHHQS